MPAADGLEIVPGQGIVARGKAGKLLVGKESLLEANGVDWTGHKSEVDRLPQEGQIPLLVAAGERYLGLIRWPTPSRTYSREAVQRLRELGLRVVLLSGDHREIALRVAREVGIEDVHAEVLPDEKQAVVARLREAGQVVAMVGDGINDAPAVRARADLGIAIARAPTSRSRRPRSSSWAGTWRGRPHYRAGAARLRTIKQNLAWAFLYNVALIPIAAGVLVPWNGRDCQASRPRRPWREAAYRW